MIFLDQRDIPINILIGNQGDIHGNRRRLQRIVLQKLALRLIELLFAIK
jgi:hypothetical protein